MTVEELIAALNALPDHSVKVWAEGCDCSNPVKDVSTMSDGKAYLEVKI